MKSEQVNRTDHHQLGERGGEDTHLLRISMRFVRHAELDLLFASAAAAARLPLPCSAIFQKLYR